jgi:hypothetical protein
VIRGGRTSNCHRSTCSPVSLLVMTMTSLEILPPYIQSLSCDMIFLMYALTWSSAVTGCVSSETGGTLAVHTHHGEAIFLDAGRGQ